MNTHDAKMSPEDPLSPQNRKEAIQRFWSELELGGDPGVTSWEVLEPLRDQVTESLMHGTLAKAERITAMAMALLAGELED